MRMILTGVDGRANANGFRAPVSGDLLGWWWLGGSQTATEKDHAYIGNGSLLGSPTINSSHVVFGGYSTGQRLQTEVAETNSFTVMGVFATTDTLADSAHVPTFMSWWSTDAAYSSQPNGSLLYISGTPSAAPESRVRGGVSFNAAGTLSTDIDALVVQPDATDWAFLTLTYDDTANLITVEDLTAGLTGTKTNSGTRVLHSVNKLRIGMGHNSSFAGTCKGAFACAYGVALTTQQRADTYGFVQNCLSDWHGITI